ncbi:MAG: major royal jelly family protein [Verrucomicrobiota bacterium]|nr:major royal jelly family protein [Verrucomicrobiota bacterium]
MTSKTPLTFLLAALMSAAVASAAQLQEVASFPNQQVTGVGVSQKSGRIFVNFPMWSDDHHLSVAEIVNGEPKAFPNEEWNQAGDAATHFVCVQSVVVDDQDNLWVLDPAAPKMQEIVKGGPKLVKIDLKTNQIVQTIPFDEDVAPANSYLNDVRIEPGAQTAFITDSGKGAIVVVDLKSGKARRLLDDDKSTVPEKDVKLTFDGKELLDQETKTAPQIASDGLALDAKNGYLYYHALTAHTLYRIKTADLKNADLSKRELAAKVETVGQTPPPDGMLEGPDGSVYLTDIEGSTIGRWNAMKSEIEPVITDKRLSWPDTLAWGPGGVLFVTSSQIQNMPRFHGGKSTRTEPYRLFKVTGLTTAQ